MKKQHPIQPLVCDPTGVVRFKRNKIVDDLLELCTSRGFGLNEIAAKPYDRNDREQLAQLIGYSYSGAMDLSYMRDSIFNTAVAQASPGIRKRLTRH